MTSTSNSKVRSTANRFIVWMLFVGIPGISASGYEARSLRWKSTQHGKCMDAHMQKTRENGWLRAAGMVLRNVAKYANKQNIKEISAANVHYEVAIKWCDFLEFRDAFPHSGDQMKSLWDSSDWNEVYQRRPDLYAVTSEWEWISLLISPSFESNPYAQLLAIETVYNLRGFGSSERVQVTVSNEVMQRNEDELNTVLDRLKWESGLIREVGRKSQMDNSPLLAIIPPARPQADLFRTRDFEIWFVQPLKGYGDPVQDFEKFEGHWTDFVEELLSENKIDAMDAIGMKEHPEVPRPSTPARDQGHEPICWMFAAASLLRTHQIVRIPHKNLVDEIKEIKEDLTGFQKELIRRCTANTADGMRCWMDSEWSKLTQSPEMKQLFPFDWKKLILKESFLEERWSSTLMLQKFWISHGFSFVKNFQKSTKVLDQGPNIKEMLQKQRALLDIPACSWDGKVGHMMVLDRFDTKTGKYIVKNSHGLHYGWKGNIRMPESIFGEIEYQVSFIEKCTSLSKDGWLWAMAVVAQKELSEASQHFALSDFVMRLKRNWNGFSKRSDMVEVLERDFKVCREFKYSNVQQKESLREALKIPKSQKALILFENYDWNTIVSKFSKFYEKNGRESDCGDSQLMILQLDGQARRNEYVLRDTHGLNGKEPGLADGQSILSVPEDIFHSMRFTIWLIDGVQESFIPNRSQLTSQTASEQEAGCQCFVQ